VGSHGAEEQPSEVDHVRQLRYSLSGVRAQASFFFSSIMRWMIGVRISSMAKPILPPFTTIEVGLDMNES